MIRPTFLGFETARKGLSASQKGIDVTGQNLTNVNTPGYTRQRADLVSMTISGAGHRFAVSQASVAGQGVNVAGVSQIRDPYLDKRFREEYTDVGYYDQVNMLLEDIESALDEVKSPGLKSALADIITSLHDFSKNPDQRTSANIFLSNVKSFTQIMYQFNSKLDGIAGQHSYDLQLSVTDFNTTVQQIANLNKTISADLFLSNHSNNEYYGPNELLDQRNVLLDDLSRFGDVKVINMPDGTVNVEMNGKLVVEGDKSETLIYNMENDKTVSVKWHSTGEDVNFTSGSIKASIDFLNGKGPSASGNETFYKGVRYYKEKLDDMANSLAHVLNNSFPETPIATITGAIGTGANSNKITLENNFYTNYTNGSNGGAYTDITTGNSTLVGNTGGKLSVAFNPAPPDETVLGGKFQVGVSADNELEIKFVPISTPGSPVPPRTTPLVDYNGAITIKDEKTGEDFEVNLDIDTTQSQPVMSENAANPLPTIPPLVYKRLITQSGLAGEPIKAGTITISDEWLASPEFVITDTDLDGTFDNRHIVNLLTQFENKHTIGNEFNGTFEDYVNFYNTTIGEDRKFYYGRLETTAKVADDMLNRRDGVSAVSLDEEGTHLMTYTKAYNAAARLMTTLDEALDTLINKTGVVGR